MRADAIDPRARTGWFGHPPGLAYLAFTEAWERFSFFGMQTLLVLYMVGELFKPGRLEGVFELERLRGLLEGVAGPLSSQGLASMVFGLYSGLAYLLPVFGGLVGDRLVGQHRMVMIGAILMALGHFLMVWEAPFLIALVLLVVGSGCLKGNLATQVSSLYAPDDRRRTEAFQIYSIGINVGVVAAPLVCGTLGELLGWPWGFGAAGIGMLVGLVIYIAGRRHLPADRLSVRRTRGARAPALTRHDAGVIAALLVVLVVVVCFLVPGGQIGNVYPLWIQRFIDRSGPGFTVPVTWFQSATAICSVVFPPLLLRIWQWQAVRGREPSDIAKLGWGCALSGVAFSMLLAMAVIADGGARLAWPWLLPFHFFYSLGYLFVWPVGMALFARAAPAAVSSMFIGIYYLALFVANNIVGWIGHYYERWSPVRFWSVQLGFVAAGAVLILLFGTGLQRALAGASARQLGPAPS